MATTEQTEAMLEQLTNAQTRLINYMAAGFLFGFFVGLFAAWLMTTK